MPSLWGLAWSQACSLACQLILKAGQAMSSTPWFAKQQSDQCGAILDRPALGLGATETLFVVQALWVETRETSQ